MAVYIRWSTDDQGEGTTLDTQLERCQFYLQSQGWTFQDDLVYIDDGYSGGSLDRPALSKLRADVETRKVECVVVYKIDRLSRSVVDIVDLALRQWDGRCFIKSTTEDVNTITPAGKMFFYILVSFAEYERNVIKERTMGGKIKRAEQGMNPGFRPPFGYIKGRDPGTVEIVAHEASVVRRICDLYLKGNGICQIAHMLNAEDRRRRGEKWNDLMVRRLLANPTYIGVLEYGKTMRVSKEQRERQGLGHVVRFAPPRFARVEGAFPAIVDRKSWDRVQRLLSARSTKANEYSSKPTYSDYLLSGIATCQCGAPINGKGAGGHQYYYCSARKRHGKTVCDAGYVSVPAINSQIETRVKALLSAEGRPPFAEAIQQHLGDRIRETKADIAQQELSLVALCERRKRLEEDYRSGDLPAKLYAKEIATADANEVGDQERLHALHEQLQELRDARADRDVLGAVIDSINTWDDLNVPERKQLLQKLTTAIRVYRQVHAGDAPTLEIDWVQLS